ncbi:protein TolQ [Rhodovibrio sodomensis]|uniref:Tol-Pal system protein TolQ n=1 Tax=Rhodovibrio sodomensis TaxID=1088 RepID=A0ABS1DCU5_9PROT|nr:protein TolQ [Rhodovibrio sodomensis]MBK1667766.1 protein TolQ [Rhodovibrio sodomensis]
MENDSLAGAAGQAAHDMSLIGLFFQADIVVKFVMLLLIAASVWSWAIIFDKAMLLRRLKRAANQFEEAFWSGGSLDDLYDRMSDRAGDPMAAVFLAAMREWRRFASRARPEITGSVQGLQQRIEKVMDITLGREMETVERRMIFLASVGSAAPFVGLFGTVWGIMNAFTSIAATKNTSLAVVAPGIAEALFATALGLVAAIPAVVAYNKLSTDIARYGERLENFAGEFSAILSRQVEEAR